MNFGPLTGNICLQNFRTTCPCHHPATVDDKKEWSEVKVGEIITKCPKGGKLEGRAVAGQLNMFARACLDAGAKSVFVICMTGTSTNSKRFYNHIDRSVFELVHKDGTHPSNLVTFRPAWLGYEGQANKMEELMGPLSEKVEELYKKHGITQSKTIIQALRDSKNIHFIKPIGMSMSRAERRWRWSLSAAQRERVDRFEHIFQQPWFKNQGSKYQQAVVAAGGHLFQQPEFIAEGTERQNVLVRQGLHLFQQPEFIEACREGKRGCQNALVELGLHLFQQPEFIAEGTVLTFQPGKLLFFGKLLGTLRTALFFKGVQMCTF